MRTNTQTVCSSGIFNLRQMIWKYNPAGIAGLLEDSKGDTEVELALEIDMFPDLDREA